MSVLNLSGQFSFFLGRQLTRSGQLSLFLVRVHDLLGSRSRVRSAVEVTSISATGRSASKRSATASICCGFARARSALRRVRAVPGALAARCTPSRPAIRSCVSPRLYPPMGCVGLSAGQPVELADLPVEGSGGGDAAQRADASGGGAGGITQVRLWVTRCPDGDFGGRGGVRA